MDYEFLQYWTDKLFEEGPPLPRSSKRRIEAEGQPDPKELNASNIDLEPVIVRGVRCDLCDKLLKYGTRPSVNTETGQDGYVCGSCRADHEVWVLPPGGGDHHFERLPRQAKCDSVILYEENGRTVKDVLLGCGAKSSPWESRSNGYVRFILHADNCQVMRYIRGR